MLLVCYAWLNVLFPLVLWLLVGRVVRRVVVRGWF
jgi:hypothetical protein